MRLQQYLNEGKISEEEFEKKLTKIDNQYQRVFKSILPKIYKDRNDFYYQNSWEDISMTAAENISWVKHINDQFSTRFLKDYEASLEAFLSDARDRL
jgi:hypothetical protein